MKNLFTNFKRSIINDSLRKKTQFLVIYFLLFFVSFVMSILNLIKQEWSLLISTSLFSILNLFNIIIAKVFKKGFNISSILFILEITILFTYFLITGGVEGFSVIWILLLPACGLLLFGAKRGSIFSGCILILMLSFYFIPPLHNLMTYDVSQVFRTRFPLVYIAAYILSLFLEICREITYNALHKTQEKFANLYTHDPLTNAKNRYGFEECQTEVLNSCEFNKIGLLMIDIDHFKNFNDTYGHMNGDNALISLVNAIDKVYPNKNNVFRWGGEEFVIMFYDGCKALEYANKIIEAIRKEEVKIDTGEIKHITASMGLVISNKFKTEVELDDLIKKADELLYKAKNSGRDKLEYIDLTI